jgi:hypothetical protein
MAQHYTQNTVSDRAFCNKCHTQTDHAVMNGRLSHCIPCSERLEKLHLASLAKPGAAQGSEMTQQSLLFGQEVLR